VGSSFGSRTPAAPSNIPAPPTHVAPAPVAPAPVTPPSTFQGGVPGLLGVVGAAGMSSIVSPFVGADGKTYPTRDAAPENRSALDGMAGPYGPAYSPPVDRTDRKRNQVDAAVDAGTEPDPGAADTGGRSSYPVDVDTGAPVSQ
jgi:hypothetical protein